MKPYKIAPSILSADYANFESELKKLEATGAEYVHIDIMDSLLVRVQILSVSTLKQPLIFTELCKRFGQQVSRQVSLSIQGRLLKW